MHFSVILGFSLVFPTQAHLRVSLPGQLRPGSWHGCWGHGGCSQSPHSGSRSAVRGRWWHALLHGVLCCLWQVLQSPVASAVLTLRPSQPCPLLLGKLDFKRNNTSDLSKAQSCHSLRKAWHCSWKSSAPSHFQLNVAISNRNKIASCLTAFNGLVTKWKGLSKTSLKLISCDCYFLCGKRI